MGRIYRRGKGGLWYADYDDPSSGKRVQRSLRTRDRAVAKERLREAELAATPQARGRRQRLSEAIDYLVTLMVDRATGTIEMYQEKGRRIITTLGTDPWVHQITRDMLSSYIARRLSDEPGHGPAKPHTISKELLVIRRALREAHDRGVLAVMPALPSFSAKYEPKETWLTPAQFTALCAEIEAVAPGRVLWASLATLAGGSAGEVERIDWASVDFANGRLLVPGTKRETRRRWVPIAAALRVKLLEVPEEKRRGRVVRPWSNVRRDLHLAAARANAKAAELAKANGEQAPIPNVSPNDLRRTFGSWLVQAGVPLFTVAKLMGHASTRMVERVYGKLSTDNFNAAMALMPTFAVPAAKQLTEGDEDE